VEEVTVYEIVDDDLF